MTLVPCIRMDADGTATFGFDRLEQRAEVAAPACCHNAIPFLGEPPRYRRAKVVTSSHHQCNGLLLLIRHEETNTKNTKNETCLQTSQTACHTALLEQNNGHYTDTIIWSIYKQLAMIFSELAKTSISKIR